MRHLLVFVTVLALVFFSSCSDDPVDPVVEDNDPVTLIDATPVVQRTAHELKIYLQSSGLQIDPQMLQYDVELFKVNYKTTYKGEEITASGIVVLPATTDSVGIVSFQHGTLVAKKTAPSVQPSNSGELILYAALASVGFVAVIPDYIGFGSSDEIFHPYYVEEATANAVLDNIRAAKNLARDNEIILNNKLFLAGYSQGGYATMATHKAIETQNLNEFELMASFPAAGGYDVKGMQEYFFEQEQYDQPYYIAYVASSYKNFYDWNDTMFGEFFNEPYASEIPQLFDGVNSSDQINASLTPVIADLIQSDLLGGIDNDAKYADLVTAFNENSLLDWQPSIRMYMYHGDADVTVPYQNSIDTYNQFISNGASTNIVTFTPLPGGTHSSGVGPYIEDFMVKLFELK